MNKGHDRSWKYCHLLGSDLKLRYLETLVIVLFELTLQDELCGIVDVPQPDSMTMVARREARQQTELLKFDEGHYM